MRKTIIAGNWKMNKTIAEAVSLVEGLKRELADCVDVEVVVCPPFTALKTVSDMLADTQIKLGCQNMSSEDDGAYTGEISHTMLKELFVRYVILGHSERRDYYKETDFWVNRKVKKALEKNLRPIVCVGEKLKDREAGNTEKVVEAQVRGSLADIPAEQFEEVVVAYEPVWAIGTGKTATSEQAQEVHAFIRGIIRDMVGDQAAAGLRIQYGGSMKPANAKELLSQPDIDGGLIGGASLDANSFISIVKAGL
ncbi:MAG: triosephosphate isomerase [Verrucomicrobiota bacterium]|jgi:triosephosphate isomerase|nr:triosephosphate isomerase [Verrucomicrobiota bacterium]MDK2963946.1 triosephosphate isomerase [Verrucomicrobiota bacterium]